MRSTGTGFPFTTAIFCADTAQAATPKRVATAILESMCFCIKASVGKKKEVKEEMQGQMMGVN
jgi:hypothetical protein